MLRKIVLDSVRYGRKIIENVLQKGESEVAKNTPKQRDVGPTTLQTTPKLDIQPAQTVVSAEKLFVGQGKNLIQKFMVQSRTNTLAAELKKQFGFRMQSGSFAVFGPGSSRSLSRRLAMYGFLTVGMAAGHNTLHQESAGSKEGVCDQIRNLFKNELKSDAEENMVEDMSNMTYEQFEFGKLIAKGCNAAVFEAKIKKEPMTDIEESSTVSVMSDESSSIVTIDDPEQGGFSSLYSDFSIISEPSETGSAPTEWTMDEIHAEDLISLHTDDGSHGSPCGDGIECPNEEDFELAIKMMFNFDAESNALSILRTMDKELVPSRFGDSLMQMEMWENGNRPKKKMRLPPHPNIVDMMGAYVDDVPALPEGFSEYPDALPHRLNPDGCGRNQTLFMVMKKYDMTLRDYLATNTPSTRESLVLLIQLMEAVHHVNSNGIAHRDLKSDNILLEDVGTCPHLVLSDFGCCLAQDTGRMWVHYSTDDINRGGNGSLMAPEIAGAQPGWFSFLTYSKSDVWAAGALAFEIFGGENPFYRSKSSAALNSASYKERDIPDMPDGTPNYIQTIVRLMLRKDPKKRPDAQLVLDLLYFVLFCPPEWLVKLARAKTTRPPSDVKMMRWILTLTSRTILNCHSQKSTVAVLHKLFLSRFEIGRFKKRLHTFWETCGSV